MPETVRFHSLDVFRGATVALMILVNTPGSWSHIYAPLAHAPWHGCTPTDLVFPFFLFAVGNALAFVMPRLRDAGPSTFWKKAIRRSLLIFGIGLLLHWFPMVRYDAEGTLVFKSLEQLRIPGVLQRIALCYLFASIIAYYSSTRGVVIWSVFLLVVYWALCLAFGEAGDPYSLSGWFGTSIDRAAFGEAHLYRGEGVAFDPEGLMSTIPAIVNVLAGFLAGDFIRRRGRDADMLLRLLIGGILLTGLGYFWDFVMPINKKIWTSSYVAYTCGLATILLGLLIYAIEFRGWRGAWTRFFDVFGKNALFIFVLSGVWARLYGLVRIADGVREGKPVYRGLGAWMYEHLFSPAFGAMNGSLLYALFHVALFWMICRYLDKKKIYIRV